MVVSLKVLDPDGRLEKRTSTDGTGMSTTQIGGCRSDRLMAGKLSPGNFGLLQQYLPLADSCTATNRMHGVECLRLHPLPVAAGSADVRFRTSIIPRASIEPQGRSAFIMIHARERLCPAKKNSQKSMRRGDAADQWHDRRRSLQKTGLHQKRIRARSGSGISASNNRSG